MEFNEATKQQILAIQIKVICEYLIKKSETERYSDEDVDKIQRMFDIVNNRTTEKKLNKISDIIL